jgi:hypothetical protein
LSDVGVQARPFAECELQLVEMLGNWIGGEHQLTLVTSRSHDGQRSAVHSGQPRRRRARFGHAAEKMHCEPAIVALPSADGTTGVGVTPN